MPSPQTTQPSHAVQPSRATPLAQAMPAWLTTSPLAQAPAGRDSSCRELTARPFRVTVGNTKTHDGRRRMERTRNSPANTGDHEEER
jgi:hypothetical protein